MNEEIRLFLDAGEESKKTRQLLLDRRISHQAIVTTTGPIVPALNFKESWYYGFFDIRFFLINYLLKKDLK